MINFNELKLTKQLQDSIDDLGYLHPTPIQVESFPVVLSGKDMVGIAQTGTGKTLAYLLPILQEMKFSKQLNPRVLILVPTRELVLQVVENINMLIKYMNVRVMGIFGGTSIQAQINALAEGVDIVVATPGRVYDLALNRALQLKSIKKLVIDEVDVMLDLGFIFQLTNIFELLPEKRQNVMYSATMTDEVSELIDRFFTVPSRISISLSGEPLKNINQLCYPVKNFYTKVNLLRHLLTSGSALQKVLVFVANKKNADRLFEALQNTHASETVIIHSNKTQNYRIRSIEQFDKGNYRILVTTDIMARGLDLDKITHVINFDTPSYPENYIHRIGRTGRATKLGNSILFYTEREKEFKLAIENLMRYTIPELDFPEEVTLSNELIPEERPLDLELIALKHKKIVMPSGPSFHEKKEKNKKTNSKISHRQAKADKYKKPKTRGDKNVNLRKKKK